MQETHWSAVKQRGLESPGFRGAQKHEFVDVARGCSQVDAFHQAVRSDNEINHRKSTLHEPPSGVPPATPDKPAAAA